MHRALTARWLNRALSISEATSSAGVPLFLCPAVTSSRLLRKPLVAPSARPAICVRRFNHTEVQTSTDAPIPEPPSIAQDEGPKRKLPLTCSGCGAFTQTNDPEQFGYFDVKSRRVKKWMSPKTFEPQRVEKEEDHVVDEVLKSLDPSKLEELGLSSSKLVSGEVLGDSEAPCKCFSLATMILRTDRYSASPG